MINLIGFTSLLSALLAILPQVQAVQADTASSVVHFSGSKVSLAVPKFTLDLEDLSTTTSITELQVPATMSTAPTVTTMTTSVAVLSDTNQASAEMTTAFGTATSTTPSGLLDGNKTSSEHSASSGHLVYLATSVSLSAEWKRGLASSHLVVIFLFACRPLFNPHIT